MDNENEITEEEMGKEATEISEEATGLSAAVGFLTSGRHPIVCVMGLLAVAAHHAQHGEITKDAFLELAENMWKTAHENHSSVCQSGTPGATRNMHGKTNITRPEPFHTNGTFVVAKACRIRCFRRVDQATAVPTFDDVTTIVVNGMCIMAVGLTLQPEDTVELPAFTYLQCEDVEGGVQ